VTDLSPTQSTLPRIRNSLLRRAEQIRAVPLALVVAPAGSGKSTLLAAWRRSLAERGETAAYLDLSPLHADAAVLVSDLLEVARHALPGFGVETARVLAHGAGDTESWRALARAVLRDLTTSAAPLMLFLDNFHELSPEASGARWLDEMLRARSANLSFVVSSRGSVPASVARLRAEGAIVEVNAQDLSLRFEEVQRLLVDHGTGDDAELAARVLARTEGWATGVQLAARRLARIDPADRNDFVARLGREPDLFGFVATEVLRDEPPELLAAVDAVALLGRCSPADVAELLGDARAESWIARAVERGVLISDGDEVWIHQLWRELLAERASARTAPADRRDRLLRAGDLLRRRQRFEGALECFVVAEQWDSIGRTLLDAAPIWTRAGRSERLRHWVDRIPPALVDRTPALLALRGIALVRPAPQLAVPNLERAMQMYRARGDRVQERALAGTLGLLYLSQLRREDALRVLRRMITLRGVLTNPSERGALYVVLGVRRYLTGRFGGALAMARRAAAMPLEPVNEWFNAQILAWLHTARGEWDVALAEIERVLERPEVNGQPFLHYGARLQRARIRLFRGDLAEALDDAEHAEEAFRDHRMPMVREFAALTIASVNSSLGDRAAARRWYDEALQRAQQRGGGADGLARAQLAVALVRWGEHKEAAREAQRALDALAAQGERWSTILPWVAAFAAWALARGGDAQRAHEFAQRHARTFSIPELRLTHHTVQLALADVARAAGDEREAQRHARAAFEFAAREGIRVVDPLIGDLVTPPWAEWAVRENVCADYALDRLAATAPERVAPLLQELARDRSADVRERALRLLARRGGRDAYAPLHAASADRVARVRDLASSALGALDLRPRFALRVRSLGGFEVLRGDAPVRAEDWKGQTARRLFARLLVAEGRAVLRETLREDLWPDAEPEAGRNNLRVAMTRLNDALDPERPAGATPHFVVTDGESLRLQADALSEWDVATFRASLRAADDAERSGEDARGLAATSEALALYEGPLLPELDDAWVLALRRELAERFAAAAHRSGPRLVRRGKLDEALALADQLLREDPADERAVALRMRAQLARGDRAAALRSYDDAVAALRRELAMEPNTELEQLAARARTNA
jgi:ATP/maltotriose-dependent transcriptional regulator MalT/DNA-binding SARP family transcriptional activator